MCIYELLGCFGTEDLFSIFEMQRVVDHTLIIQDFFK